VRVSEATGASNKDSSAGNFVIASPVITVLEPGSAQNGFGFLTVSEPYDIKWATVRHKGK